MTHAVVWIDHKEARIFLSASPVNEGVNAGHTERRTRNAAA
jgi:hypothetical protein